MKLLELEVNNYTRLHVTGIKNIVYRPKQPMQIILASNGAGKSSLLKEVIPNVEDLNTDYGTGGYRIAKYSHNDSRFTVSFYRDTKTHSFIKDGRELNEAGIQKIQKTLIEEHFNLNKYVHEILTSTNSLTMMSVGERKRWFTEILSNTDYDYALNIYNKIKVKIRDLKSFITLTQSKMLKDEEFFKSISPEDITRLETDRLMFMGIVDKLLEMKINNVPLNKPDITLFTYYNNEIENLLTKVSLINLSRKEVDTGIIVFTNNVTLKKDELTSINDKLSKLVTLNPDDDINSISIEQELTTIHETICTYEYINKSNTPDTLLDMVKSINHTYDRVISIGTSLYPLRDYDMNKYDLKLINLKGTELQSSLDKLNNEITTLERELHIQTHHSNSDDVNCPKCNHVFKPNFDLILLNTLKEKHRVKIIEKERITKLIAVNSKLCIDVTDKRNLIGDLISTLSINTNLLDYVKNETSNFTDISNLSNILNKLRLDLPDEDKVISLIEKRIELTNKLEVYTKVSSEKLKLLKDKKKEMLSDKTKIIEDININNENITRYRRHISVFNKLNEYRTKLITLTKSFNNYKRNSLDSEFNKFINDNIAITKDEIYNIENTINKYHNIKDHYDNLKIELEEYKLSLKTNNKLEEYLSPTKGLIGLSISGTINTILEKMNHIINQVWKYNITILPCDLDATGLTFKFPVKINNAKTIPDVIKGSSSIKEIIDLAFKITVMELLDMLDYPLILDEFSKTMDPVHRVASYEYIEKLSKEHFSQIFMVSHYESMYSRFVNTDVIVLNNDNIGYSDTNNTVIKIK